MVGSFDVVIFSGKAERNVAIRGLKTDTNKADQSHRFFGAVLESVGLSESNQGSLFRERKNFYRNRLSELDHD